MKREPNNRIAFWDNIKAFLIFLVVLGHTGTVLGVNWLSAIYAFHMPLFIFISGYFSRNKESLWQTIGKLVYIYLGFDLAYLAVDVALGKSLTIKNILIPGFSMWYVLSLIFWRTLLFYTPLIQKRWGESLCVAIVLSLLVGFIPIDTILSFQRTFVFLPFFLSGFYFHQLKRSPIKRSKNSLILIIFSTLFFALTFLNYHRMPIFYGNHSYIENNEILMRAVQLLIAFVLCWAILQIAPSKRGKWTELGENSLIIYLLHPPILKYLKMRLIDGRGAVNALVVSVVTIGIIYLVKDFKLFRWLK